VKLSTLVIILLSITLVITVTFGTYYINNQNPVEKVARAIPSTALQTGPPEFKFAVYGPKEMPLNYPMAVTASGGTIYVSDTDNHQVQVYDYNGKFQRLIGAPEEGKDPLVRTPYGLAVSGGKLFVADLDGHHIAIFGTDGEFQGYFKPQEEGLYRKPGDLKIIDDKMYLTDVIKMKVLVFDLDGKLLLEFGEEGTEPGQFSYPNGVAVDKEGNIFVADSGNNRIQVFDSGGSYLRTIGGEEGRIGSLTTARGIDLDRQGNIYVVTGLLGQVVLFNSDGEERYRIGSRGTEDGQLNLPNGLYIDDNGRLFVTEVGNNRVSVFD